MEVGKGAIVDSLLESVGIHVPLQFFSVSEEKKNGFILVISTYSTTVTYSLTRGNKSLICV